MDAVIGTLTRRGRIIAFAAALLCMFALTGPTLVREVGDGHGHLPAVKVAALAGTDQYSGHARVDQPVVAPAAVLGPASAARVVHRSEDAAGRHDATTGATSTRGPPVPS